MKRTNSLKKSYRVTFIPGNRIRHYYTPQTFWQKVLFSLVQDKYAQIVPAVEETKPVASFKNKSDTKSVIETPVRIPLYSVIRTKSAVSTRLTEEIIR